MSRRLRWSLLAIGVLLVLVAAASYLRGFERVTRSQLGPARGEAVSNPYFVLARSLANSGQRVHSQRYLEQLAPQLQPGDTVVLAQHERGLDAGQRAALVGFVAAGGHLLLQVEPWQRAGRPPPAPGPLLADFGLQAGDACASKAPHCPLPLAVPAARVLAAAPGYLRVRHGRGSIDLVEDLSVLHTGSRVRSPRHADIRSWRGDGLARPGHQLRAWTWLSPNWDRGTFYLVHGKRQDRWWLLLLRGHWPAVLPLALLLAGLLWAASQRLGPLLPEPAPVRRSLREHVAASAAHLWRHGRGIVLYDAAHRALLQQLQLRVPAVAGLHGPALEQALARHLGWPVEPVAQALRRPPANDTRALQRRIFLLMEMRTLL